MSGDDRRVYRLREGVLSVGLQEENILLSIEAGKYFGVKGAMRHLLEDLRSGLTLDEMIERICERYEVEPDQAKQDLQQMLTRLAEARIVEPIS